MWRHAVLSDTHAHDLWHAVQALVVFSRLGVYMRVPGVDAERFAEAVQSQGILGYIDTLSGGSISRVGIFSLGIAPTGGKADHARNVHPAQGFRWVRASMKAGITASAKLANVALCLGLSMLLAYGLDDMQGLYHTSMPPSFCSCSPLPSPP